MNQQQEGINRENFHLIFSQWIAANELSVKQIAAAFRTSIFTIKRLLEKETLPTDEMIKQASLLMSIGFTDYSKLKSSDKEKFSEAFGTIGAGTLGFASISAVVSSLGFTGLSAAGITSGLSALGGIVGTGMIGGISIVAAIPVAAGTAGYAAIKGIKYAAHKYKLNKDTFDTRWEMPVEDNTSQK